MSLAPARAQSVSDVPRRHVVPRSLTRPSIVPAAGGIATALSFWVPALIGLKVEIVGQLLVSEVLLVALLPWLALANRTLRWATAAKAVVLLGLLWLFGQVVTDLARGTEFGDYSRGWAKIGFTLTNFASLYLLLRDDKRRALFALGLAFGLSAGYFIAPNPAALLDAWKWAFAAPVTLVCVLVACALARSWRLLPSAVLALAAFLNLLGDYRSLAGICFLTAAYLAVRDLTAARRFVRPRLQTAFRLGLIGLFAAFVAMQSYEYVATTGLLGQAAREKLEAQGGPWGLLLGGRSEILASSQAIADSPILGHGSWARDFRYVDLLIERLDQLGYEPRVTAAALESGLIPAHSYLLGAWVEAGLAGALFWSLALGLAVRALMELHYCRPPITVLFVFGAFALLWDILFSPFGETARLAAPFYIVLLLGGRRMFEEALLRSTRTPGGVRA